MPVAGPVLRHAAARPGAVALRGPRGALTYAALAADAGEGARHLLRRGVRRGSLVAIGLADPAALLTAVLAADLAGAVPLVGDPAWDRERWARMTGAARPRLLVDTPLPAAAGPSAAGPALPYVPAGSDLAWACFSSGSTGRPRAVVRTRASWTGSFPHLSALAGMSADDVVLVPGPLWSSLYAFAAVHALAIGATAVVPGRMPPGGGPQGLAALCAGATVAHLVPHLLPAVLADPGRVRAAVVGGAALAPEMRAAAERAGVRVVAYYGATELSFVAADADGTGLRPFPEVEIEVRPGAGALGEVWARSPWLAEGYLGGAAGPLRRDGAGWMSVGDVARPYREGERLRLRGRGDGAIQTGGATVVPEDVEEVLRKVPGVGDIVVIGSPHPSLGSVVTAVVEGDGGAPPPRALLEAVARGGLDAAQRPRRWYAVPSLPRTGTGKPARALVAARLADGDPGIRRLRDRRRRPVVVAARRTPIGTAGHAFKDLAVDGLAAPVLAAVARDLAAQGVAGPPDDVVLGNCMGPGGNVARVAALAAGFGHGVPGLTVDRQCGSGLAAILVAAQAVRAGEAGLVLAGGAESASTAPLRTRRGASEPYARAPFAPGGYPDPDMGPAAEALAAARGITRERQDAYAARSHAAALAARERGVFGGEIVPVGGRHDDQRPRPLRAATLARLPAAFAAGGTVTAGNSSPVSDGAAAVAVVPERLRAGLPGLRLVSGAVVGCDPALPGWGPVPAVRRVLARAGADLGRVAAVEVVEAFAAQVLAVTDALGLDPLGADAGRVCPDGGALALGHPWGATGAVVVTRLFTRLVRGGAPAGTLGLAAAAVGGGLGVAALFEVVRGGAT
ncbi:acetyl-CoA C-acyltransferase [Actinomadura sp. ATCC 31491]|uniref:Acetyl-CoA C-acyltransferase n=1 Tax=Actinomadura luzonensis TaxID=2805427 RepID=A0ABT0G481_9ACTN|nr:acetyl-CoA C-acyltransferase [Actinomadura luzonensis]MCK2219417.1 acetyl-CoA C-acyltransferase [Actinomadura luzonensis]